METERTLRTSPRDFLHVIFKRKTQILLFFGATVCTVAVGSFIVPPTYEATGQILVKTGREDVYMPILPGTNVSTPPIRRSSIEQINGEIEILKSRFLAEKVVEFMGPAVIYKDLNGTGQEFLNKALLRFQESLTIEGIRESNVINISFKHTSPRMAATVVNALVNLYLDRHLEVHKSPKPQAFFRMQAQTLDSRAKLAEEKLEAFKNKHNLTSLEEEKSLLLRQEADLRTKLRETLSQEAEIENRILQLRHQAVAGPETTPLDDRINTNLRAKLVELEIQEHDLLIRYRDQSRLVQRVRQEIEMVRRKLAEHRSDIIQEEILRNEIELQVLKAKDKSQKAHLADYRKRHESLNGVEMKLNRLREEVQVHRESYQLYLTKFEEARISDAMDKEKIANVRLIEPARPPLKPVSPNIPLNVVLAIFLGGFGALGMALFSEHLADKLEKDEDVENLLHLPVLATIPLLES